MNIKNLYVYVDGGQNSAFTVKCACRMAESFSASLTGFVVIPDAAGIAAAPETTLMSPRLVEEIQKSGEKQASAAENIFRDMVREFGISVQWVGAQAGLEGTRVTMARNALHADLIVIGQQNKTSPIETDVALPEDLVIDSGRPIVLIPGTLEDREFGGNILIAWNGSREAARAVFDAMPFLSRAERVTAVTVAEEDEIPAADHEKLRQLLIRHGIESAIHTVSKGKDVHTSEVLFKHARECGADMLVAGAYGQFRLREGLFGGVSKSIFDNSALPTLMSH